MGKIKSPFVILPLVALIGLSAQSARAAFTITIAPGAALAANADALACFNRAARQWTTRIVDDITVTVNANLVSLSNPNIIGSTSSLTLGTNFDVVRDALAGKDPTDTLLGALPTFATFSAFVPANVTVADGMATSKANFKALGFTGLDDQFGVSDGEISFNQNFAFDFDNRNGVSAGRVDFETVAAHEIGHLLGFSSVVDQIVDLKGAIGTIEIRPLDLYRFGNGNEPQTLAQFSSAARDLRPGGDKVMATVGNRFILSGIATNKVRMSTGLRGGAGNQNNDGNQASHWKADELTGFNIGNMDPTLSNQTVTKVGPNDFAAMRLIGYTLAATAPEPTTLVLLVPGLLLIAVVRRRGY